MVLSAHNEVGNLLDAIELGVSSFIIKPLHLDRFIATLYKISKNITERKLLENHLGLTERDNVALCTENRQLRKEIRVYQARLSKYEAALHVTLEVPKISAEQVSHYAEQVQYLIRDDLEELQALINAMEENLIAFTENNIDFKTILDLLGRKLQRLGATLAYYNFFEPLGHRISAFAQTILHEPFRGGERRMQERLRVMRMRFFRSL